MISILENIVISLTEQMVKENLIDREQKEEYIYALITIIEKTISIGTILWISVFVNRFIPTLMFLICFFSLRKRTGGYHANTFLRCYIETIGTYIIILYVNSFLDKDMLILYTLLSISVCIILSIGTINHPNLHMNKEEMLAAKKSARLVLLLEVSVLCFLRIMDIEVIVISYMATAVVVCAITICMAKLLGQEVKVYEEN